MFEKKNGYPLDLENPQTNNQRMIHKMINDRNPLIMLTADKVKVRDYITKKLGIATAEEILIPIYHISKTGKDIPNADWDFEFFLKANHGSGMNRIIPAGEDPKKVAKMSQKWLNTSFGQARHEWSYRDIPRRIICEKVLREEDGRIPMDIKYYCFNGKCKLVLYYQGRWEVPARIFSDEKQQEINCFQSNGLDMLPEVPKINTFQRMLEMAQVLSRDFQYCRVDFYSVEDKIYFGELTHYTGSGLAKLDTYEIDLALGRLWLPENNDKSLMELFEEVMEEKGIKVPGSISTFPSY